MPPAQGSYELKNCNDQETDKFVLLLSPSLGLGLVILVLVTSKAINWLITP